MSRFLACMTDLNEATIANQCYNFIQDKGTLPSDDEVFELFHSSKSIKEVGRKINRLFLKQLENALLTAINHQLRDNVLTLLSTTILLGEDEDTFTVSFGNKKLINPTTEELDELYAHLTTMNTLLHNPFITMPVMFAIDVSPPVIQRIKEVVEEGISEPTVDSSGGITSSIIIDLNFIADMALTNQHFKDDWQLIWSVLTEHNPALIEIESHPPHFLALCASNEEV